MLKKINFNKSSGLVPAIIQDVKTSQVLMLGYMNEAAFLKTMETKRVTFYSRSRQTLWVKGETSGNFLEMESIALDCDQDTLLVKVNPLGPVCHTGSDTCFDEKNEASGFLHKLESVILDRKNADEDKSYTASLFKKGINKIAQKVGEEAIELVIESKDDNSDLFLNEAADLMYHYLVLLVAKGFSLKEVINILENRKK
ncbi:MAG: phosphoribosyl-ATP pyrophosphohydrolase/phosphoribosyl-AMP cyclohydrolase [Saprospiraceae bacterium]|jgi:phosphoribosyl-ATP pyrophosphohydrolase/phosphoribosyl-AMP cyclohydrolase